MKHLRAILTAAFGLCLVIASPTLSQTFEAIDTPLNLNDAEGDVAEWLQAFAHEPETFDYKITRTQREKNLTLHYLRFPSPFESPHPENNTVPGELYVPNNMDDKVPAAVVLDILHGNAILPRMIARRLASEGIAALYISMPYYNSRRPANHSQIRLINSDPLGTVNSMRQAVMDVRRAKAILASRPEVDPERICITGVSLGGIMTALAAGVDGEFHRVVPILGGGDIAALTFHSPETRRVRQALTEKGVTQKQLAKALAPVEPMNFAYRIGADNCLMINAQDDHTIPKENAIALANAIGGPTILWSPLGHTDSVIYLPNVLQKTVDFFKGKPVTALDIR